MSKTHKIQWLNLPGYKGETWNPIIGCSKISEGCENCYAEKMAVRLSHIKTTEYYQAVTCNQAHAEPSAWNGKTYLVESALNKPIHWKKPRVIFVCSMGDLFHESVPFGWIDRVYETMEDVDVFEKHIFVIITKRPERMLDYYIYRHKNNMDYGHSWIWLGVTTENQEQANKRIPVLLKVPAAVRFVSIEPMLGPVSISEYWKECGVGTYACWIEGLNWVICGGESGHKARPMHPDWVRSLRHQCKIAETPFFFKQWGELIPSCQAKNLKLTMSGFVHKNVQFKSPHNPDKTNTYFKVGKHHSGNLLDGKTHMQYPQLNFNY